MVVAPIESGAQDGGGKGLGASTMLGLTMHRSFTDRKISSLA